MNENIAVLRGLPEEFADLQPWVEAWARPNELDRHQQLLRSTIDEVRKFYDAMFPRLTEIMDYLDKLKLDHLPEDAQCLLELSMTFVEISHTVELRWKQTDIRDSFSPEKICYLGPSLTL